MTPFFGNTERVWWIETLQLSIACVSIVLNGVLLRSNYRRTESRWATDGILITLTAILDLILGAYLITNSSIRFTHPELVRDNSDWCTLTFIMGRAFGLACLVLVALLSLVRYLVIVRGHKPHPRRWTCISLFICLFLPILFSVRAKLSTLYVFPSKLYCSPVQTESGFFPHFVAVVFYGLSLPPLVIIPFCYASVSFHYSRLVSNIYGGETSTRAKIREKIIGTTIIVISYWFVILPDFIQLLAFRQYGFITNPYLDGLVCCLSNCISLINALFPLLYHEEIRREASYILSRHKVSLYSLN
ncbi:hypothetical protein DSO57_1030751 [Entomophthora muscae]|uniref:Uncharacterized protein n=1 Tax=Entomophthora muscae TaxID=34485 RepID=A0ACC2SDS5_9FUNG|nr:hypothetical protein DSO57_1030751 [Entomophthora muscae]